MDPRTENTFFDNLPAVTIWHKIPGPIHVDSDDPDENTQTVERSHSGVKMRLRSGRGVYRHNLQSIMDLEDFISNRTTGKPSSIFKRLGNAATLYCSVIDNSTIRASNIPFLLATDHFGYVEGLTLTKIKTMCTEAVFNKSKRFEVLKSSIISTQVNSGRNTIDGEFRAAIIYDQHVTWNNILHPTYSSFNLQTLKATCSCKYYLKVTIYQLSHEVKYCYHIIGQLRRVIFVN